MFATNLSHVLSNSSGLPKYSKQYFKFLSGLLSDSKRTKLSILCMILVLAEILPAPVECLFWSRWRQKKELERKQRMNDIVIGLSLGVLSSAIGHQQYQMNPLLHSLRGSIWSNENGLGLAPNMLSRRKRSTEFDIEDSHGSSETDSKRSGLFSRLFTWPQSLRRRLSRSYQRDDDDDYHTQDNKQTDHIQTVKDMITKWDERNFEVEASANPIIAVNGRGYTLDEKNRLKLIRN